MAYLSRLSSLPIAALQVAPQEAVRLGPHPNPESRDLQGATAEFRHRLQNTAVATETSWS